MQLQQTYDVFVLGATPAGIACAVRAARQGMRVLLANRHHHIGGFITSGAGGWEGPYDGTRSPLLTEVQQRASDHYRQTYGEGSPQHAASLPNPHTRRHIDRRKIEPCVAERIFEQLLTEHPTIHVVRGVDLAGVQRRHESIEQVTLTSLNSHQSAVIRAGVYVDCTYEGDLAAQAQVAYRVGRESRAEYGEPHAGRVFTRALPHYAEPSVWPRDAAEGRLNLRHFPHAKEQIISPESTGEADHCVMAYNYRLILTSNPANRLPIRQPAAYDPEMVRHLPFGSMVPNLPNDKVAWNAGRLIGPHHAYPEANWPTRQQISQVYLNAILSQLWFLQNDSSVPPPVRSRFQELGLPRDEFTDNGHLPYEIYVREARRIVGRYVFTQHDAILQPGQARTTIHADSVAITDWPLDSVACTSLQIDGGDQDGALFLSESSRPAQIPYRCLLPRDCANLLVGVCISASHVGFGTIRLEPVWMQLGEVAGYAAAQAITDNKSVSDIDVHALQQRLVNDGACITFFNDVNVAAAQPWTKAIQWLGTKGFFDSYDAQPGDCLDQSTADAWTRKGQELFSKTTVLKLGITRADAALRIYKECSV